MQFYSEDDNKDVLISKFIETRKKVFKESGTAYGIPIEYETDDELLEEAEAMYEANKSTIVYTINNEIMKDRVKQYEDHWVYYLNTAYKINASIIRFDVSPYFIMSRALGIPDDDNVIQGILSLTSKKYLKIPIMSGLVGKYGKTLSLSKQFITTALNRIPGTTITQDDIYIQYAPSMNIYLCSFITRFLHLYL